MAWHADTTGGDFSRVGQAVALCTHVGDAAADVPQHEGEGPQHRVAQPLEPQLSEKAKDAKHHVADADEPVEDSHCTR